jgi:hypothetical protein
MGAQERQRVTSPLPSSSCWVFFRLPGFETFPYFAYRSSAAMSRRRGSCLDFCEDFSERGMRRRSYRNRIESVGRTAQLGAAYPLGSRVVHSTSSALIPASKRRQITGGRNCNCPPSPLLLPSSSQHGLFVSTICQSCLSYFSPHLLIPNIGALCASLNSDSYPRQERPRNYLCWVPALRV